MKLYGDIPVCGEPVLENALSQIQKSRSTCEFACLMADHHMGYGVPIGGVLADRDLISPTAVGYDIACGNMAVKTDMPADQLRRRIKKVMDDVAETISFGVGRVSGWGLDHALFEDPRWSEQEALQTVRKEKTLKELAREQLGTVGSGNHYVDLFVDEKDSVWVGVHFGSRGFGHGVATHFLKAAGASEDANAAPVQLEASSDLGAQYVQCMNLAGEYAYAGREAVVAKVVQILGAKVLDTVHNHHNFAWRERHNGLDYWVCRKGATPAGPGQRGFIGGSMGDNAVIVEGVESPESRTLYYSTVHGAGRVMSRTQATGKSKWGKGKGKPGVLREDMMKWVRERGVELRGADVDESPQVYKRLDEVLPQQGATIRVLHRLRPVGVAMAGSEVVDPYKD